MVGGFVIRGTVGGILSSRVGIKNKITAPRIGYVRLARGRRMKYWTIALVLLPFGMILLVPLIRKPFLVENNMIVVGIAGTAFAGTVASSTGIRRFYAYALINLVLFVGRHLVSAPFQYVIIATGVLLMAFGVVLLERFVGKYPLSGVGSNVKH